MIIPLYYCANFDTFRPALLLSAMSLDLISAGSLATPMDKQRENIKFCLKLGKSAAKLVHLNTVSVQ